MTRPPGRGPQPDPGRRPAPGVTDLRERARSGFGSPEGVVYAKIGSVYQDIDPAGSGAVYKKTTASENTGWVELGASGGLVYGARTDEVGGFGFPVTKADFDSGFGEWGIQSGDNIPDLSRKWLPTVTESSGVDSSFDGKFVADSAGWYTATGQATFDISNSGYSIIGWLRVTVGDPIHCGKDIVTDLTDVSVAASGHWVLESTFQGYLNVGDSVTMLLDFFSSSGYSAYGSSDSIVRVWDSRLMVHGLT